MCRRAQPCSCRGCSGWAGRGRLSLQHSTPGSGAGSPPKGHGEQSPKPWDQGTVRGPRSLQRGTAHATWAGFESPGWGMALGLGPRGAFPGRPLRQPECPSLQQSPGAADAHPGRACSHRTAEAARLARPGPRGAAVGAGRTRFPGAPHPHLPGGGGVPQPPSGTALSGSGRGRWSASRGTTTSSAPPSTRGSCPWRMARWAP